MKRNYLKGIVVVGYLLFLAGVVMGNVTQKINNAGTQAAPKNPEPLPVIVSQGNGPLTLAGQLVQEKIFSGGDGTVTFALTMHGDEAITSDHGETQLVDLVIVLDQSGSMAGQKIEYARQAILDLLNRLSEQDRIAIIGYADEVQHYSQLDFVTAANRERFAATILSIAARGSTNLGAGLQAGINMLLENRRGGVLGKVILISDGLANRGITDLQSLGNVASIAAEETMMISTVGVGNDFNPQLMSALASRGAGNFYYLQQAESFAELFEKEFRYAKTVAAYGIEISVPLPEGVTLQKAAVYPVTTKNRVAVFRPGDVLGAETRKLFLTFHLPAQAGTTYQFSGISARYQYQGAAYTATLNGTFEVACVNNPNEAVATIRQSEWEEKVVQEDFSVLQEQVGLSVQNRDLDGALRQIDAYYADKANANAQVGSTKVTTHLKEELAEMREQVRQTFKGSSKDIEKQVRDNSILYINGAFTRSGDVTTR